jgi:beta-lactam-binding protein with PASTA domain
LLLLLLLLLCGGAYAIWRVIQNEPAPGTTPTPGATSVITTPPATTPPVTTAPPTTPPATTGPVTIAVPNVVGLNGQQADEQLRAAGFTNIKFVNGDNDGTAVQLLQDWTVQAQNPVAGQQATSDQEITVTVIKPSGGM